MAARNGEGELSMLDRDRLAALMGPLPEAAPLEPVTLESVRCDGYTRELVEYAGAVSGHRALVIGLPRPLAWLQAFTMEIVGGPMTRDNLLSLATPNVCANAPALPFGLSATALEAVAPAYLGRARRSASYDRYRENAKR